MALLDKAVYLLIGFAFIITIAAIRRIYFHPLSGFPGPRFAASTQLWELYNDLVPGGGGQVFRKIDELHEELGPIVRIGPNEVHVQDASWLRVLYTGPGVIRDKDPYLCGSIGTAGGTFGTTAHHIHRKRRSAVSPLFSKQNVRKYQHKLKEQVNILAQNLEKAYYSQDTVHLSPLLLGWSSDALTSCVFGRELGVQKNEAQRNELNDAFEAIGYIYPVIRQFSIIIKIAFSAPSWIIKSISTDLEAVAAIGRKMKVWSKDAIDAHPTDESGVPKKSRRPSTSQTLLQNILNSNLPEEEKELERVSAEAMEIFSAGSITTSKSAAILMYNIIAHPEIHAELAKELKESMPNPMVMADLEVLETLPWLNAVIMESFRVSNLVASRLGLISPRQPLRYGDYEIPAGTIVSMNPGSYSLDPNLFDNPKDFAPRRWIADPNLPLDEENDRLAELNRIVLPFALGTRACLGRNFAMAQLRLCVATLFRRFDFDLIDTVPERDVIVNWAHLAGEPAKGSVGVKVRVSQLCQT